MNKKQYCNDSIKIIKLLILIENELAKGILPIDRMLFLEALLKEIKIEYCASNNQKLYKIAEKLMCVLFKGRIINNKNLKGMQLFGQELRKYRKEFENCKYDQYSENSKLKLSAERGFNRKTKNKLHPLLEPMFNVLEIYKQLLLLLDHLADKQLRCKTCILKHTLFIEGLTEEAIALDNNCKYLKVLNKLLKLIIKIRIAYAIDKRHAYCKMIKNVKISIKICNNLLDDLSPSEKLHIFS